MTKTRGQLISMFQHMKTMPNDNAIKHIKYEDIDTACQYLLEDKQEIEKVKKILDNACTKLEGLCTVIDILTDKDTAHDKEYWKKKVMEDVD